MRQLAVVVVSLLGCAMGGAPAPRREPGPYKGGAAWPLRNFNGLDLLEPALPVNAVHRGDLGRITLDTALPIGLMAASFSLEHDARIQLQLGRESWLGLDRQWNNYPLLYGAISLAAFSILLPDDRADHEGYSWALRLDRASVLALGVGVTSLEVELLRPVFGRTRPNGHGEGSRPSGHAATAFAVAAFASDVLRETLRPAEDPLPLRLLDEAVCALPYVLATYISLSRVHGEKHYLTDVLLGGALGAFTTHMFYAWSFLRWEQDSPGWLDEVQLSFGPAPGGFQVALRWDF